MNIIEAGQLDLGPMVTHHARLDDIVATCELFASQRDGVLKVELEPRGGGRACAGGTRRRRPPPRARLDS